MSGDDTGFSDVWAEYTAAHLEKRTELNIPAEFDRGDWESVGYIPPKGRSDNEVYNWSAFYDFFCWLQDNGYIE